MGERERGGESERESGGEKEKEKEMGRKREGNGERSWVRITALLHVVLLLFSSGRVYFSLSGKVTRAVLFVILLKELSLSVFFWSSGLKVIQVMKTRKNPPLKCHLQRRKGKELVFCWSGLTSPTTRCMHCSSVSWP